MGLQKKKKEASTVAVVKQKMTTEQGSQLKFSVYLLKIDWLG